MFGWKRRYLASPLPFFLPRGMGGRARSSGTAGAVVSLLCLLLTFFLATGARLLELPFWDNPAYRLGEEFLLGTHDAYHWIAGAEGFEFGVGHPMSELARLVSEWSGLGPAQAGFWLPPFMSGLLAVAVFCWGWGLGQPFAGLCAGVLSSLAPAFCARTLLGFYDTDLVVLLFAVVMGLVPALWLAPWLASLPEVLLPRGAALLSRLRGKMPAQHGQAENCSATAAAPLEAAFRPLAAVGKIASGQVLYENARAPAAGAGLPYYGAGAVEAGRFSYTEWEMRRAVFSWPWLVMLVLSGLFAHQTQDWHSLFAYLVRFCAFLPPALILVFGPCGGRGVLLSGALCHVLPLTLGGLAGGLCGAVWAALLLAAIAFGEGGVTHEENEQPALRAFFFRRTVVRLATSRLPLVLLWGFALLWSLDSGVFEAMLRSFSSYADRAGDMASLPTQVGDPLIFPSVAQSIIEVQTVSLDDLLAYVHPLGALAATAMACFVLLLLLRPALAWFIPLFALLLLSLRMGARMTMFGPPPLMLALCLAAGVGLEWAWRQLRGSCSAAAAGPCSAAAEPSGSGQWGRVLQGPLRLAVCLVCTVSLGWPLLRLLPDYAQGPIITREHAQALSWIHEHGGQEAMVWNWWDWGYATHHFARRSAIADGARHGGPSLYLPAAVYTTADARFARQIIKYTALKGNVPGRVFEGLGAAQAQELMRDLSDRRKAPVKAPGRQYIVVSFELLRLGLWVTRYGSWNFESKQGPGALMNNLVPRLQFNKETGVILADGAEPVYASNVVFFDPEGLERFSYNRYGAYHFLFNIQPPEKEAQGGNGWLRRFWLNRRGDEVFSGQGSDKMVMDDVFFNTMMVQLLICDPDEASIAPYFRLVYDNVYTRVYEVF